MENYKQIFLKLSPDIYTFAQNSGQALQQIKGGSPVIQFRAKNLPDHIAEKKATEIITTVREFPDTIVVLNDFVDLAVKLNAPGIHVGQDTDYKYLIRNLPDSMIIGVSVDTIEEAVEAERAGATYLGAGAVFKTATKPEAPAIGTEQLEKIVQAVSIPVVAIGGINLNNISEVIKTGARFFAVISSINNSPDIENEVRKFRNKIKLK